MSVATSIQVAQGYPDLVLVVVVAIALLRGPVFGAAAGFWGGLVLDVAALATLGLSSLLLTLAGYWAGRFGQVASKSSPHPPLIAVALGTVTVTVGSALLHFMLGQRMPATTILGSVLVPSLALNLLLAYPVYRLARRVFPFPERERREVSLAV